MKIKYDIFDYSTFEELIEYNNISSSAIKTREKQELIEQNRLKNVNFYRDLIRDEIKTLSVLGKLKEHSYGTDRVEASDIYKISISLNTPQTQMIPDNIIDLMEDVKLLKDVTKVEFSRTLILYIDVDYNDIKDLEIAEKAINKYNL